MVFEAPGPHICTFGLSDCRVKPRRLRGRRGFTRQPENSKRANMRSRPSKTPPKFNEKTTERETKKRTWWLETEKKLEILGPPPFGAPPSGLDFFWVWAPPFRAMTHTRSKIGLARIGFGQSWPGQNHEGGNFKDVRVLLHPKFWLFCAALLKMSGFTPH